ncbi:MAG TPA: Rv3235 family protein [Amycolatopsis sp.]|nr:Rv3235 family protein [Amycolatopsis sp.]
MKPLRPYEPCRNGYRFAGPAGQLTFDLPATRIPRARPATATEPLPASQIRTVFTAILDARTGVRPLSQLQGLVHPRLYRHLGRSRPLHGVRFTLKSVRSCRVAPDAYEACGTAHTGRRSYGVVGRFELLEPGRRWRCVLFDLVRAPLRRT